MLCSETMPIAYISGPYTASTPEAVEANVRVAATVAAEVAHLGYAVICPHTNSHWVDMAKPGLPYEYWLEADLAMLEHCQLIVMCSGWENSRGAVREMERAIFLGLSVYHSPYQMPPAVGKNAHTIAVPTARQRNEVAA